MAFNYKIKVSYDGKNYYGFQKQENQNSIQEELEKAISQVNSNQKINLIASGRTDAKVHAYNQVCNFISECEIDFKYFVYGVNKILPPDIKIKSVEEVDVDFHSRYDVKEKKYQYLINNGEYDVFLADYVHHFNKKLDLDKMIEASKLLIGKKDFRTFTSARSEQNTIKKINTINMYKKNDIIVIEFSGNGFLRYMVRKLCALLIDAGQEKVTKDKIEELLDKKDISAYSKTAPGCGLYLMDVLY